MRNPKLENWYLTVNSDPYTPPEAASISLVGEVYDHPDERHYDGKPVRTSRVTELDLKNGVAKTMNTTYELGEPDKEWLAWLQENGYGKIQEFLDRTEIPSSPV